MNENHNLSEILPLIPQYANAIYSEGVLYFSGAKAIATESRKAILINDINLIKEQIANLEKLLG